LAAERIGATVATTARHAMMCARSLVQKGSISLLLVSTLMMATIQCVAACTLEPCKDSVPASLPGTADLPPCHQHHDTPGQQTPAPCSHQVLVLAQAVPSAEISHLAPTVAMNVPVASFSAYMVPNNLEAAAVPGVAPPTLAAISSVILRI
jgi:hypothetical protein